CDAGGTCTIDNQCKNGLVCGQQNGKMFGKEPTSGACWDPLCTSNPRIVGCGYPGAPCGSCDSFPPTCDAAHPCPPGQTCGSSNGPLFGLGAVNVCWPTVCTGSAAANCGEIYSPCGFCSCTPDCSGKTCGGDASNGCGGLCKGFCQQGEGGCQRDSDCA